MVNCSSVRGLEPHLLFFPCLVGILGGNNALSQRCDIKIITTLRTVIMAMLYFLDYFSFYIIEIWPILMCDNYDK